MGMRGNAPFCYLSLTKKPRAMLGNRKQVSVAGPEFNKLGTLLFGSVW